jgi:hypothetical protein
VSFLFGGVRRHEDRELKAANRRFREHIARDINDERTLASGGEERIRRGNHWLWLALAVAVAAVLVLVNRGGTELPLTADCSHPGIAVGEREATAGTPLHYRLTGPDHTRFVVTLDGAPVQGDAGSLVRYTPTQSGPALELQQCLSPTLVLAAPAGDGPHELGLLRLAEDGTPTRVQAVTVTVVGTR